MTFVDQPRCSAQRRYMRIRISAKSAASTPPAPARMVMTASRSSYSPESRVTTSSSESVFWMAVSSFSASAMVEASSSSRPSSTMISRSSMRDSILAIRFSSAWRWESLEVTFCAASGSSQRSGAAACCSSSAMSALILSRSETCSMEDRVERSSAIEAEKSVSAMVPTSLQPARSG